MVYIVGGGTLGRLCLGARVQVGVQQREADTPPVAQRCWTLDQYFPKLPY